MPKPSTILAFDYGEARVGVAMGNSLLQIPHPLATICAEGMWPKIDQIGELITKWQPQLLIVGCPHAHDNPQKMNKAFMDVSKKVNWINLPHVVFCKLISATNQSKSEAVAVE